MTQAVSIAQSGSNNVTFRNKIINGGMGIAQRGTTAVNTGATFPVDRWQFSAITSAKLSLQQNLNSATPPAGFVNYLGAQSLAATSPASTDFYGVYQQIEGLNTNDLDFGKSTAKSVTISFWVQSSLTGAFSGALENAAQTRSYCFSYTISSANTWTYITVTIPGDTTGTWATDNTGSLLLWFNLNSGSNALKTANVWNGAQGLGVTGTVGVGGTLNATWYITGVQLEAGTAATPFEQRLYSVELALCQRYYEATYDGNYGSASLWWQGNSVNGVAYNVRPTFKVMKRAAPTIVVTTQSENGFPNSYNVPNSGLYGFQAGETANATLNGAYFSANWTASAEL